MEISDKLIAKAVETGLYSDFNNIPEETEQDITKKLEATIGLLNQTEVTYDSWHNKKREMWVIQGEGRAFLSKEKRRLDELQSRKDYTPIQG